MPDLGHDLLFGAFIPPTAARADDVVALAQRADAVGLDLFAVQDHPYQPAFLDTWTLLSALAPATQRIRLVPDVINLPLRLPSILARSAASLDILSGGRVELGIGAGAFWDAIEANGGPRRSPGEALRALEEAIRIIRALWSTGRAPRIDGKHYSIRGAKPGPQPVHRIDIWVGAYGPKMLQLIARVGDGWLPSAGYLPPDQLAAKTNVLDDAAADLGRDPAQIRRLYNVDGAFTERGGGFLQGPPRVWVEQLTELALTHGTSAFILSASPGEDGIVERFAEEVVPAVRAEVERERSSPTRAAPQPVAVEAEVRPDDTTEVGRTNQQLLLQVHDALRAQLTQLQEGVDALIRGRVDPIVLRGLINRLAMRQNYMSVGAFCAAYCRFVATHHTVEDQHMFPNLRAREPELEPVLDRLEREHETIAEILVQLDEAVVAMIADRDRIEEVRRVGDRLADELLAHLTFEEDELLPALGRMETSI
jgi:alkanesulfonate monooxygenase SsuD/methylene tetrahydromethanopterin reductase-like flavin-dependent oxidoreductase (luciferase family)/hemerythrin-like domain-containing protein